MAADASDTGAAVQAPVSLRKNRVAAEAALP